MEVEGDGDPLILVPGGPGVGHGHYHPWFSQLADGRAVVYFDQLGTGRSDRLADPAGYTVPLYAETIEALRRHLGAAQVAVLGVSFGGVTAAAYAIAHPDRVRRLVLSNAQVDAKGWQESNIGNVNHELRERYPELWEEVLRLRGRGITSLADEYQQLYERVLPELEWFDPVGHPRLAGRDDPAEAFAPEVYRAFVGDDPEWAVTGSLARHDPMPGLATLPVPTLCITGRHDRVTTPRITATIARALPPDGAQLVVFERSAHRPWVEEPAAYLATVGGFLR